jgi:eukaryotic-like serine/threonine-protein kinase
MGGLDQILVNRGDETVLSSESAPTPRLDPSNLPALADYELLAEIARGGMGVVYKARQISLNRLVALKMILGGQFAGEAEVRRFQAEAQAAANLNHPNIVGIYGIGMHQGQHYFSMQYIDGRTLAQLEAEAQWRSDTGKTAAHLVAKIARAVQYAHERGVLHRDLKPANVLIDTHGEPHILDFGLARRIGIESSLTLEGTVVGTPSFMPPEQAAGRTADLGPALDVYSLGAILYFLLTGRPPFAAASALDTLVQVLEGEVNVPRVINPRVARGLERICLRCLEKSPQRRYPSAAGLAEDLERFVRDEPVQIRTPGLKAFLLHWMRRQPALVWRLAGLGVCIAVSQWTFQYRGAISLTQHLQVISALSVWALLSVLCQWALEQEHWNKIAPVSWVVVDSFCLTIVLWLDDAMPGPLLASFPALVAVSGLWFRLPLVGLTTLLAVLGYSFLVFDDYWRHHRLDQFNWHIIFVVLLLLTGCAVAYQIHRVSALSRFYGWRKP